VSGSMDVIEILRTANPVPLESIDASTLPSAAELRTMRAAPKPIAVAPLEADGADGARRRGQRLVAAAAVLLAALAILGITLRDRQPASDPVTTVDTAPDTPQPTAPDATAAPSTAPTSTNTVTIPPTSEVDPPSTSGGMWPQSSVEEVRSAQALADAGDPAYTWQVDPSLSSEDGEPYFGNPETEIIERFLREVLGWDAFVLTPYDPTWDDQTTGRIRDLLYLRCATDEPNALYPAAPCAPTIDELTYETVSIDLAQLDRTGASGLWVVSEWRTTTPFTQVDWRVSEPELIERLERFLAARIAGEGAEGLVVPGDGGPDQTEPIPLLYATSTGAPYEQYEIERVSEPVWPWGFMGFEVRLLADGGRTVVAQDVSWDGESLRLSARSTTENGQPVPVTYVFFDGEVTVSAAAPWTYLLEEDGLALGGTLSDQHLDLAPRPRPVTAGCVEGEVPDDAAALAESIRARPDLMVTEPQHATVGGVEGLTMDVTVASTPSLCDPDGATVVLWTTLGLPQRRAFLLEPGHRMRVYVFDIPHGSIVGPMAIAVVAPEARFEDTVEAATPVIESVEFHTD
jgi:hypothetical protein